MVFKFIHKENSNRLILFFNGWGMDERVVQHFNHQGVDVMMAYSYHHRLCKKDLECLKEYKTVYVVAWSMGVYFASVFIANYEEKIDYSVAINGTLTPVDDEKGIPHAIFKGTLNNLSKSNLNKFNRRMFSYKADFDKFNSTESSRSLQSQIDELAYIDKIDKTLQPKGVFDKVFIGQNDRIMPSDNQNKAWERHLFVIKNATSHFPFYQLSKWSEILNHE